MSQSGSQAAAFFREVAGHGTVWLVRDDEIQPALPVAGAAGVRAVPFWSSRARAARAAAIWGNGLRPASMPLSRWRDENLPELAGDGYRIGVNWTGPRLVGWDFTVAEG